MQHATSPAAAPAEMRRTLPFQLAFELHTRATRPCGHSLLSRSKGMRRTRCATLEAMPVNTILEKGPQAVAQLFERLHWAGYRVVFKEINRLDRACAEFVLVKVDG